MRIIAVANKNDTGHDTIDLMAVNGKDRTVYAAVHLDFFWEFRSSDPATWKRLQQGQEVEFNAEPVRTEE